MPRTALALGLLALAAALTLPYLPTWYHMEAGGRALQAAQSYAAAHPAQPNAALDRALHHFERAAQRAPGDGYAYRRLGQAWLLAGNNDAARQALLRAAELRPDHPLIWIELGRAYDGLGQVQKALEAYEQGGYGPAVEAAIANYLKVADWQAASGARRAALDVIETRILALDPDNLPALVRAIDLTRALGETEREAAVRQRVQDLRPGQMTPPAEPRLAAYTADAVQRLVDEGLWRQGQADKYGAQ